MRFRGFLLPALLLATASVAAPPPKISPVAPGDVVPGGVFTNLNPGEGRPDKIDLAQVLGRKPVLLYYWIAGNPWAEKVFVEVRDLVAELQPDSLALYGVAVPQPGRGSEVIQSRLEALGIEVPVLADEGFVLGKRLDVHTVPHISIIDAQGRLKLANGGSLRQVLEYKMDLATAIRRAASGTLRTYGYLDSYYPVKELEGQRCPDFEAPLLAGTDDQRWSSLLDDQKLNVLIFWSVSCGHCRRDLPLINAWLKQHPDAINVVAAASVTDDAERTKTQEFCDQHDLKFPVFADQDSRIGNMFQVTSTPTILIIGPNGVIDTALTSTPSDFGATVEKKKAELIKPPTGT